jgi:hypothetical protein
VCFCRRRRICKDDLGHGEEMINTEPLEGAMLANGFEDALVGYGYQFNYPVAVYSMNGCMEILMKRDGMNDEEAMEFFNFNVQGAWVGESTPIFLDDMTMYDDEL